MGELLCESEVLSCGSGVAAADDRCSAFEFSQSLADFNCTYCETRIFEHTHRSVPEYCLCAFEFFLEECDRFRSDIETHESFRDLTSLDCLDLCRVGEVVSDNCVDRKDQLSFALSQEVFCQIDLVFFKQGCSDFAAHSLGECISHTAADDDFVSDLEQVFDDADLIGYFSAAENCNERSLRIVQRAAENVQFLFNKEADC